MPIVRSCCSARLSRRRSMDHALLVVLGYSRLLWCRFYPRQDLATLLDGLEEAFLYFGGVPQEILFDRMKAVITRDLRLEGGAPVRNAEFLRFAHHGRVEPRASLPETRKLNEPETPANATADDSRCADPASRDSCRTHEPTRAPPSRQRPEQNRVHDREDRRGHAHTRRQRTDDGTRERRPPPDSTRLR